MDTITHGLFGLTLYGAVKKEEMTVPMKRSLFVAAIVGSEIPDIDVLVNITETGRMMEQMWHRGLTHSIFLVPLWALLIYGCCAWFFKVRDRRIFYLALLAVFIHDTIDLFNAWGTGYFEPFSSARITLGTMPIVDLVFWGIFLLGFTISRLKKSFPRAAVYRWIGIAMLIHFSLQTVQGLWVEMEAKDRYEQTELAATFVPCQFKVIGKKGNQVEIVHDSIWTKPKKAVTLTSSEHTDLTPLFKQNPRAEVLLEWSPFVVIVDDEKQLGIFDPRFYQNGESFLAEYIRKK
ncbi:metal-dependent hydrolase [Paenactinomyces guangxiensis]|uniref:Metal-dependent hydrolase n=1 Tax=Paenactinomyces guangxiensis TaxID=1490290 RepID=A0A7W1WN89_9BACL|nr:metal-dependent hydrolase [Paenactinomyces guangxiensis]MBA4492960.1 metal-dependent hydrolase [Paenactinomyces guangxiensis]MBH8590191.1 metal-dependent hydrolase [Paenactinomyces guangxiensis]